MGPVARVAAELEKRAKRDRQVGVARVVLGLAVIAITVFFLGSFVWMLSWLTPLPNLGFWLTLLIVAAILLPITFWQEWRTRGRFFDERSSEMTEGDVAMGYADAMTKGPPISRVSVMGISELLLYGPRLVLGTDSDARGDASAALPAAELAVALSRRGGRRTGVRELGASPPAARLLVGAGWATVSGDGERIWLTTEGREALKRLVVSAQGLPRRSGRGS